MLGELGLGCDTKNSWEPKKLRIVVLLDGVAGAGVACVLIY